MAEHLADADIAVNAIDFTSNAPLVFDKVCFAKDIPVVHPYNLGYGALACVLTKKSLHLTDLSGGDYNEVEIKVVKHVINLLEQNHSDMSVLKNVLNEYIAERTGDPRSLSKARSLSGVEAPPPQLAIASAILGGLCTDIFLRIVRQEKDICIFPEFYYMDNNIKRQLLWKWK